MIVLESPPPCHRATVPGWLDGWHWRCLAGDHRAAVAAYCVECCRALWSSVERKPRFRLNLIRPSMPGGWILCELSNDEEMILLGPSVYLSIDLSIYIYTGWWVRWGTSSSSSSSTSCEHTHTHI
ncbi:predicted protein [Histoplasma capsulatum var. duboisii H88]|uniref:Predicted protein n=1 Tax=Ajellomyces capsulatus (strain H88) TaxID=544711 RepID=F0UT46_AJEC8|nr:predicted protein [Histoplasma capsulatum var. duboisii H88]QSS54666.1 hypothetical protein I7I53_02298 [Histoplasma capsulatum var. duboisii H88]